MRWCVLLLLSLFGSGFGQNCRGNEPRLRECENLCDKDGNNCKIKAALLLPQNTDFYANLPMILARCCPNLKKLALRGCELIGDDGLEAVAYYCRGLTQLNIQDTPVTLRGYRAVKKYCKRCVIEHTNPGFC